MLLAIDVGNTNTVFALYAAQKLTHSWRMTTDLERSEQEWFEALQPELAAAGCSVDQLYGVVISSVAPPLVPVLERLCQHHLAQAPLVIDAETDFGMSNGYDDPKQLGVDRIVNAVAAYAKYQSALIVVDFGTATTVDYVSADGAFCGGVIAPGLKLSAEALAGNASQLPSVELDYPPKVIATNTLQSMQAGICYGYVGLVDGLVKRMRKETGASARVVATGGLSSLIAPHSETIDETDPNLTLEGMRLIFERNRR